ncbi:hypothetical protein Kfla_6612 [Kribbella flavida DSM 17836]|uniref:Uncharacterized protein n=1 Tax=Kribbella flavida (strain DSM 17836 / JCM 10339 / NBRC 14399) TaxID=479435 RepID=D2PZN8_KRIFD|nr:hypothetical protein [Kribbella flavida]ADB35604.1 hypothetical protein Kfla_6612 [Kribbella flavida DSM 17836]
MKDSFNTGEPRPRPTAGISNEGDSPNSESILGGLGKATWSEEEGVSYEVALNVINEVVGAYSGLIGREEASPSPNATKIAAWRQAKIAWAQRQRDLSPADPQAVQAVRQEAADLLRTLSDHG